MKTLAPLIFLFALLAATAAAEKTLKLDQLPAPVRKTVDEQLKGAQIKNILKEKENGKTVYEIESTRGDGKTRDFVVDETGSLVVIEEEIDLASLPAGAKAAIGKQAAGAKVTKVEALIKGSTTTYEAAFTRGRKKSEVIVTADGAVTK